MTKKGNILVVDDDQVERQTLTDILRLEGYHVASAANGEAALDFVRQNPVDLILLDLRMPGMSGLEVIKVLNHASPDVEIIMLTAHGSMDSAIEALRNRVQDYLLKPASPTLILDSVARGMVRRNAKQKSPGNQEESEKDENIIFSLKDGTMVDFSRRLIRCGSHTVSLTPAEGRLLKIFSENVGKVYSHRELVLLVQGYSTSQQEAPEIMRPLVSRLRQKLSKFPAVLNRIISLRGTGYVFEKE
jgi:DNA-binding response OmpR family regulator